MNHRQNCNNLPSDLIQVLIPCGRRPSFSAFKGHRSPWCALMCGITILLDENLLARGQLLCPAWCQVKTTAAKLATVLHFGFLDGLHNNFSCQISSQMVLCNVPVLTLGLYGDSSFLSWSNDMHIWFCFIYFFLRLWSVSKILLSACTSTILEITNYKPVESGDKSKITVCKIEVNNIECVTFNIS